MKDSGIPWLGAIPEGWKLAMLKRFVCVNSGREVEKEIEKNTENAVPVYGSGGIFKYTDKSQHTGEAVLFGRKGTLGKPLYVNESFWAVDTMYYLTHGSEVFAKYDYYLLNAFDWEPFITHTAIPSIVATEIVRNIFPIPPLSEQKLIADYLDRKCGEIDELVVLQEKMIEELKSYKQSVITEAVTKGLNPNAPMKDSGIEWIGEIPGGWPINRLKFLCDINTGNQDTQDAEKDGAYDFYVRSPLVEKSNTYSFEGEGILMAGDGAGAGRVFHHAFGKYAVHQRVYRLSDFTSSIVTDYLFYYLSSLFPNEMDRGSAQSTVPSVRLPMLLNFPICVPNIEEQIEIVSHLNSQCSEIDSLIALKQQKIEHLKEYKKSLIYEYVTGKKQVASADGNALPSA